ncbi:MAG: D-alanyl-alanine synthetase [Geminicoccaceae bacterium]
MSLALINRPDQGVSLASEMDGYWPRRTTRVDELTRQVDRLMDGLKVAVVFGGNKTDAGAVIHPTVNPRPWKSYEAVAEDIAAALRRIGFRDVTTMPDDMHLGERLRRSGTHFVWLNTGGVQGVGAVGHAAAMLEMFGIPYIGHNPLSAGTLDHKHLFKRDLAVLGVPTAPFMVWHLGRGAFTPFDNPRFYATFGEYEGPFVVKPVSGRASHHVLVVDTIAELADAVGEVYGATENHVLIERYLAGREFCVAVCGPVVVRGGRLERLDNPFSFAAVERKLDKDERIFTSMDTRAITVDRVNLVEGHDDQAVAAELKAMASRVYLELDLETLVRLDVRADEDGKLHVLEANPKPDLAAPKADKTSIVCAGLGAEGMSYDDLVLSLFADRIDHLFSQRRGAVSSMTGLLG